MNPFLKIVEDLAKNVDPDYTAAADSMASDLLPDATVCAESGARSQAAVESWERFRAAKLAEIERDALELGWSRNALVAAKSAYETAAIAKLKTWDVTRKSIAVLSGSIGTGKTVAAAVWMFQEIRKLQFVRASAFAAMSRYAADSRRLLFTAEGLVLDDLGAEYQDAKGSFLVDLDELIDTYYGNQRPLIITTNLRAADFKARYGGRIEDRLRESAVWLSVAGPSLRKA